MIALQILALTAMLQGGSSSQAAEEKATARKGISAAYDAWQRAVRSHDAKMVETLVAPSFYAQLPNQKMDRKAFVDGVLVQNPQVKLNRFLPEVLTLTPDKAGDWVAVITEKIEYEIVRPNVPKVRVYRLQVTRDGWHKDGNQWQVTYTESISAEDWRGAKPPIPNW